MEDDEVVFYLLIIFIYLQSLWHLISPSNLIWRWSNVKRYYSARITSLYAMQENEALASSHYT
jgi:hypothetical protein